MKEKLNDLSNWFEAHPTTVCCILVTVALGTGLANTIIKKLPTVVVNKYVHKPQ